MRRSAYCLVREDGLPRDGARLNRPTLLNLMRPNEIRRLCEKQRNTI